MQKKKMITCSICGQEKPELNYCSKPNFHALKDGMICTDCAEEVVAAHPVSYRRNPEYEYTYVTRYNERTEEEEKELKDNGKPWILANYLGLEELSREDYLRTLNAIVSNDL